ncbi:MAG: [protein-PII] uridylyltransferase [Deltaproteobacteria bacterium]|nr:[protein-PII] uridylyltransferase [Deltaproteobacteria bacterium]
MGARIEPALIEAAKARLAEGRARLERTLRDAARATGGGRAYSESLSDLVDQVIVDLACAAAASVRKESGEAATLAEGVAILALGGYGRRELSPRSDIDLLFLLPGADAEVAQSGPVRAFIDQVLYGLWDLGLEVGQSVRTVGDCVRIGREDPSVLTALLEARPLPLGHPTDRAIEACEELERSLDREVLSGRGAEEFVKKKLEEAERRRQRYGDSLYLLEPDVKHGEGGLRDQHMALWIARARWRARSARDLLRIGILSPRELRALERASDFLLRVRAELHLAAGRRRDGLGFDLQERIAHTLGFVREAPGDHTGTRHGTERFMRAYYFHARQNQLVSRLIIERATSHPIDRPAVVRAAPGGFKTFGGTLSVADRGQFESDPLALMRIFRVAQEEALEIYSYTKDLIVESLRRFGAPERRDPRAVGDFLTLLEDPRADGSILLSMHELGMLRRMIPEVGRITARWQHSLYHVYTVDIHSLFVLRELKRLRSGWHAQEQPDLSRRIADLPRPALLYLGGLLHDIGKGWQGGDHSSRGARVALAVGTRLEAAGLERWTQEETADLAWLVAQHLTMSDISQRRDLADPDLVQSFADDCRSEERLAMLHCLTFADMKATSPKVWNDWKGLLLAELFEKARVALAQKASGISDASLHLEARRQRVVREILASFQEKQQAPPPVELLERFARAVPERYLLAVPPRRMRRHVDPWREVSERGGLAIHLRHLRREGLSELTVVCPDRPGLLSLLAGTLSANRLQIMSAQIFSLDRLGSAGSSDSPTVALDILSLRDADGGICEDSARWTRVREDLHQVIFGGADVEQLVSRRLGGSTLRPKHKPHVETKIVTAKDASQGENVFDVFCQDHLGALYTIAKSFAEQGLSIRLAKVSTQGDRVADGFYVTDAITGQKISDEKRLAGIADALKEALNRGIARAGYG